MIGSVNKIIEIKFNRNKSSEMINEIDLGHPTFHGDLEYKIKVTAIK